MISSRTPEGDPHKCPVCRKALLIEPSLLFGDAPCPHCGNLLRFELRDDDVHVSVADVPLPPNHPHYACPGCKTRIPLGTKSKPSPRRCPVCDRRLWIPSVMSPEEAAKFREDAAKASKQPRPSPVPEVPKVVGVVSEDTQLDLSEAAILKFRARLRSRVIWSCVLLVIGGVVLYAGFRDQIPLFQALGVIFVIYSGVMQVRVWSVKQFVRECQSRAGGGKG
jgi:hypothetical protein